jgi:hypothetical protein
MFIGNVENQVEFKRGKDKQKRKRRQNTLGGHVRKGAKIAAGITGASLAIGSLAAVASKNPGLAATYVKAAPASLVQSAVTGGIYGAGVYGGRKLLAKDRSKKNFDYSANLNTIEFGRGPDKKKRKRRRDTALAVAGGATGGGAYAGLSALGSEANKFNDKIRSNPSAFAKDLETNPKLAKQNQRIQDLSNKAEGANKLRATQEKLKLGEINEAGAAKAAQRIKGRYGDVGDIKKIESQLNKAKGARVNKAFTSQMNKKKVAGIALAGAAAGGLYGYGVAKARQRKNKRNIG